MVITHPRRAIASLIAVMCALSMPLMRYTQYNFLVNETKHAAIISSNFSGSKLRKPFRLWTMYCRLHLPKWITTNGPICLRRRTFLKLCCSKWFTFQNKHFLCQNNIYCENNNNYVIGLFLHTVQSALIVTLAMRLINCCFYYYYYYYYYTQPMVEVRRN